MIRICLSVILLAILASCGGKRDPEYMQEATGKPGDMIVLMDSLQRKGPVGEELSKVLQAGVEGLPRDEPMFNVTWVHPRKSIRLLTQVRNLVYVFTLDQKTPGTKVILDQFSPETLQRIRTDTSFYITTAENEFSRGQKVMYLFGDTEENLIRHIRDNGPNIAAFFNNAEKERLMGKIFTRSTKSISGMLEREWQIGLKIPVGYKLAQKEKNFIWFREIEANADKDVFVAAKPYNSQYQLLPDSLIAWREQITRKYIYENPENPESYVITEREVPSIPVRAKQVNFKGAYAMEIRGLWRTNNFSMGGPFVGYGVVDSNRGLIYYLEGFAYSPGKDQREIVRELETVLWTFETGKMEEAAPAQ